MSIWAAVQLVAVDVTNRGRCLTSFKENVNCIRLLRIVFISSPFVFSAKGKRNYFISSRHVKACDSMNLRHRARTHATDLLILISFILIRVAGYRWRKRPALAHILIFRLAFPAGKVSIVSHETTSVRIFVFCISPESTFSLLKLSFSRKLNYRITFFSLYRVTKWKFAKLKMERTFPLQYKERALTHDRSCTKRKWACAYAFGDDRNAPTFACLLSSLDTVMNV